MKKTLIILVLLLSLLGCERGPLIEDYKIEGISLGDSLLDYLSKEEIQLEISLNKVMYTRFGDEFGEVYLYDELKTYSYISFFVKPDDNKYIIYGIYGKLSSYQNQNINQCFEKQKEIGDEFSVTYKEAKKDEDSYVINTSTTKGESIGTYIRFKFESEDIVEILCSDYDKSVQYSENNVIYNEDALTIALMRAELYKWLY